MDSEITHCDHNVIIDEVCGKCIILSSQKDQNDSFTDQFLATKTREDIKNLIKKIQEDALKSFIASRVWPEDQHRSFWRNGHKVGRTVYQDDKLIGVMDTPELASLVALAVNSFAGFADDEMLMCMTDDYQSMQKALVQIQNKTEHDSEVYLLAAEGLPAKLA